MNLKDYREAERYSQKQVADKLKVTAMTIISWEKGDTEPRASQIYELASLYKVTPNKILKAIKDIKK